MGQCRLDERTSQHCMFSADFLFFSSALHYFVYFCLQMLLFNRPKWRESKSARMVMCIHGWQIFEPSNQMPQLDNCLASISLIANLNFFLLLLLIIRSKDIKIRLITLAKRSTEVPQMNEHSQEQRSNEKECHFVKGEKKSSSRDLEDVQIARTYNIIVNMPKISPRCNEKRTRGEQFFSAIIKHLDELFPWVGWCVILFYVLPGHNVYLV